MPSDRKLIACMQEHEMKTVLKHFKKSATEANVEAIQKACKAFKATESYRPHNRDNFYKYVADKNILKQLA